MSGFSVDPPTVRAAGTSMTTMADAVLRARLCAEIYVHVDGGGTFLNDIASSANAVRERLGTDYGQGGNAYLTFESAGEALRGIADDYVATDAAEAARYDGKLDVDPVTAPEYMGGQPGIRYEDYASVTDVPDAFEGFNQLDAFTEGVDYVIGLDWISDWLTTAGIVDPFGDFRDRMAGDWKKLGKVVGAMRNLQEFWEQAEAGIASVPATFTGTWIDGPGVAYPFYQPNSAYNGAPNWSGNACDATVDWMNDVASKVQDHAYSIELKTNEIEFRLQAMYEGMDLLLDTIEGLLKIMPWGQSFEDFLKDFLLPWKAASRLFHIAGEAAKVVTKVRALYVLCTEAAGLFEGLLYAISDLKFPMVTYHAPDVDG